MPGVATAQLLSYAEVVDVDMDSTNDVNFADVQDYGHRVVVQVNKACMDGLLGWRRLTGQARPSAMLVDVSGFRTALTTALNSSYVDIDGVTGGLHYGTANMNTNPDTRLRAAGVSANDLPLAFMLYKLYGMSSATTLDRVYNLEDAHGMLASSTVAAAVSESFVGAITGAVDRMFRDLMSADPHRFFDASGAPIAGMFEMNRDAPAVGTWKLATNDSLEIKLKMMFQSKVTRRGVAGDEHDLSASGSQTNEQVIINPGDYFYVRLQLKADPNAESGLPPPPPPPPQYAPHDWTLVGSASSSNTTTTATSVAFTGGYNWSAGAYSSTRGYASGFTLTWKVSGDIASMNVGITDNLAAVANPVWANTPYGINAGNGNIQIREGYTQVDNYGSFNSTTEFKITYDGVKVRYYANSVLLREVARAANGQLMYPVIGLEQTGTVSEISFLPVIA